MRVSVTHLCVARERVQGGIWRTRLLPSSASSSHHESRDSESWRAAEEEPHIPRKTAAKQHPHPTLASCSSSSFFLSFLLSCLLCVLFFSFCGSCTMSRSALHFLPVLRVWREKRRERERERERKPLLSLSLSLSHDFITSL